MEIQTSAVAIRARAARLRPLVAGVEAALWLLLVLERFGAPLAAFAHHIAQAELLRMLAVALVRACPEVAFLLALDATRRALAAFASGELFAPTITRLLQRIGVMLAIGAFVGVFIVPGAERLLGAGPGYWIAFDVSAYVLGAVGLTLTVLARVLRHASELQTELDEMF